MKKLLWTSAMALAAVACITACDDSGSSASNSVPEYKAKADLPDTCELEVAKVDTSYFACLEDKWIEVKDSVVIEKIKKGLDEKELKEELEDLLSKLSSSSKKPVSSSSVTEYDGDDGSSSSSAEEEESSGGSKKKDKTKDDSSSASGGGSGEETEKKCGDVTYDPKTQICGAGDKILSKCGESGYDPETQVCGDGDKVLAKCGKNGYDPETQVCGDDDKILDKCGDETVDPETQYCKDGTTPMDLETCGTAENAPLYNPEKQYCTFKDKNVEDLEKCGSANYNPEYEYCAAGTIHTKLVCCSGSPICKSVALYENSPDFFYNPETQYCNASATVADKLACGTAENAPLYNPETQICGDGDKVLSKCGEKGYDPETQVCGENYKILGKCGDETFDPETHYCNAGSIVTLAEAVIIAAKTGKVTMLEELDAVGAKFEERDTGTEGFFPIHWAVKSSKVDAVKFLFNKGVDIGVTCNNGYNAYDWAAIEGYSGIMKFLKANGAKHTKKYYNEFGT